MIQNYDIVGSYNNERVLTIDAERSVNLFEYIDPLGKKPKVLIPTSGIDSIDVVFPDAVGGFRASFLYNGLSYHVIGPRVYLVSKNGTDFTVTLLNATNLFTTATGYVGIDANTFQIIFVDGARGYIYDTQALTFTQITDSSFPTQPIDVCFLDGFFIVANGNTNSFQMSMLNQGLVWGPASNSVTTNNGVIPNQLIVGASTISGPSGTANYATGVPVTLVNGGGGAVPGGLAFGTQYYAIFIDATHIKLATSLANAQSGTFVVFGGDITPPVTVVSNGVLQQGFITSHPGNIVACRTLHRRLFLFSSFFTEVWENAGLGTTLPIRRNNTLLMEYGTVGAGSVAVGFDKMFFLSLDRDGLGPVMEVVGTESIPVSTRALDFTLSNFNENFGVTDCRGFLMKESGLIFYRMNFTAANHTFVYNVTLSNPASDETKLWHEEELLNGNRHPAQTHVYLQGINYVGDYAQPILYEVDSDLYTNNGDRIRRMRIGRPIVPEGYQRIRINRFQLDLLQGDELLGQVFEEIPLITETDLLDITTETGVPIITEQLDLVERDINPIVYLTLSKDGGQTYGNSIGAPMGKSGQRTFRTVWRKLGTTVRGQPYVPKIEFFEPVPFVVLGAAWDFEVLPE